MPFSRRVIRILNVNGKIKYDWTRRIFSQAWVNICNKEWKELIPADYYRTTLDGLFGVLVFYFDSRCGNFSLCSSYSWWHMASSSWRTDCFYRPPFIPLSCDERSWNRNITCSWRRFRWTTTKEKTMHYLRSRKTRENNPLSGLRCLHTTVWSSLSIYEQMNRRWESKLILVVFMLFMLDDSICNFGYNSCS